MDSTGVYFKSLSQQQDRTNSFESCPHYIFNNIIVSFVLIQWQPCKSLMRVQSPFDLSTPQIQWNHKGTIFMSKLKLFFFFVEIIFKKMLVDCIKSCIQLHPIHLDSREMKAFNQNLSFSKSLNNHYVLCLYCIDTQEYRIMFLFLCSERRS